MKISGYKHFISLILVAVLVALFTGCREGGQEGSTSEDVKAEALTSGRSKKDYEEAIRNLKDFLKKEPDNIILLVSLGNAYYDMGMNEKAIGAYRKALEIYPNNVAVRTDLGTLYRRIGKPDEALDEYRKSLEIDPRHTLTRYNVGVVLHRDKNDVDGAIKAWEELLRIDPYFILANEIKNNIKVLKKMKARAGGI